MTSHIENINWLLFHCEANEEYEESKLALLLIMDNTNRIRCSRRCNAYEKNLFRK